MEIPVRMRQTRTATETEESQSGLFRQAKTTSDGLLFDGDPLCRATASLPSAGSALFYVASMSHGIADKNCKPLKQHGNGLQHCDMETRDVEVPKPLKSLATPAGFEPATFSLEGCCSA